MESPEPNDTVAAEGQGRDPRRSRRILARAVRTREIVRVAYRDPQHVSERLSLFAAVRLAEPSRRWAVAARRARPRAAPAELADAQRRESARIARIDGAISGTPFFVALVPGYVSFLWQETRMALRIAALYGRDPGSLETAAEILVLRGIHPSVNAAHDALLAVVEQPLPQAVETRRPLKTWLQAVRRVLVLGGFLSAPSQKAGELSHPRLRAIGAIAFGAVLWVITWVLPLTFMAAMACGCESHSRKLGKQAIAHWDEDPSVVIRDRREHRAHSKRQMIRGTVLALSIAIPIGFVVYSNHVRQTSGLNWFSALGALVAVSIVIAVTVLGSRQIVADSAAEDEGDD